MRRQVGWLNFGQAAVPLADRRSHGLDDDCVAHAVNLLGDCRRIC
jgi:hypothetical protein